MRRFLLSAALLAFASSSASAEEPILGKWRAPGGGIVEVTNCGGAYCATVVSGRHKGKTAGRMNGSEGTYEGTVTDPRDDRSYSGRAAVDGDVLKLKGCALKVLCKTQTWTRA
ncbi:hypothetical protein ASG43_15455 [Aureimonas sp. Leaf454]|uniref:DUF2147 domain-containing protein n=1 Tax=Aureimonas sp. Leaf454 TaxID=1736381 RepID=UPI0006F2A646|nr:DUF2147 domain-containing protein [Aureimonas sp. Leaf454]KQT42945.1 hypothetical protein ASG43_15455 [Aureimonas sp. Leaf454]